jgi:hypothetical protein
MISGGEKMELLMIIVFLVLLLVLLSVEGLLRKVHKMNTEILEELRELKKR